MRLRLIREPSKDGATLGVLFVDGVFECFTLEDPIREIRGKEVATWKVAGKTAISAGRYSVLVNLSQRFKQLMPLLIAVPGFEAVRIHPGNSAEDTEGCILVGRGRSAGTVSSSRLAFDALVVKIQAANLVTIAIENP